MLICSCPVRQRAIVTALCVLVTTGCVGGSDTSKSEDAWSLTDFSTVEVAKSGFSQREAWRVHIAGEETEAYWGDVYVMITQHHVFFVDDMACLVEGGVDCARARAILRVEISEHVDPDGYPAEGECIATGEGGCLTEPLDVWYRKIHMRWVDPPDRDSVDLSLAPCDAIASSRVRMSLDWGEESRVEAMTWLVDFQCRDGSVREDVRVELTPRENPHWF